MRPVGLGLLLSLLPSVAHAAPVNLECWLPDSVSGMSHFDMTLNEATASLTYIVRETGAARSWSAVFTANAVVFGNSAGRFTIDRTTLDFHSVGLLGDKRGQCHVAKRRKRAF